MASGLDALNAAGIKYTVGAPPPGSPYWEQYTIDGQKVYLPNTVNNGRMDNGLTPAQQSLLINTAAGVNARPTPYPTSATQPRQALASTTRMSSTTAAPAAGAPAAAAPGSTSIEDAEYGVDIAEIENALKRRIAQYDADNLAADEEFATLGRNAGTRLVTDLGSSTDQAGGRGMLHSGGYLEDQGGIRSRFADYNAEIGRNNSLKKNDLLRFLNEDKEKFGEQKARAAQRAAERAVAKAQAKAKADADAAAAAGAAAGTPAAGAVTPGTPDATTPAPVTTAPAPATPTPPPATSPGTPGAPPWSGAGPVDPAWVGSGPATGPVAQGPVTGGVSIPDIARGNPAANRPVSNPTPTPPPSAASLNPARGAPLPPAAPPPPSPTLAAPAYNNASAASAQAAPQVTPIAKNPATAMGQTPNHAGTNSNSGVATAENTRPFSSFPKAAQDTLARGGIVKAGDGRLFQIINGVPRVVGG